MLRFRPIKDAGAAASYYGKSDGGYYLDSAELRREVGGNGAKRLGLDTVDPDQFKRLLQGLNPHTGEQLTAKLVPGRLAGWDITASVPKGVTIAIQAGDKRVQDALWAAGREAMADLEREVVTRVRKGGEQDDRATGNLVWYGFEHPETRPAKEDGMPDPDRHIHFVIPNVTWDEAEQEFKAIKFRPVMDMRKYFDRRFDLALSSKLADLGYSIETKQRPDPRGGKRYYSWDINGMPQSVVQKFSRRAGEVEELAAELKVATPLGKDKLGATSRLHKRDDMTFDDYRRYWNSRITPQEGQQILATVRSAVEGKNPRQQNTAAKGVAYAIGHEFYKDSVVPWHQLAITAMERCMGAARPDDILPEAKRQGVLLKDGQATTRGVLDEEAGIIQFARDGRGTCRPMGKGRPDESKRPERILRPQYASHEIDFATLSREQQGLCRHVWESTDQVVLIRGGAGTGKTTAMKAAVAGMACPVAVMAPSSTAARDVLRKDFRDADTVAAFLNDRRRQDAVKGGAIWVDEAGQLAISDLAKLVSVAKQQGARLILQGDPKQHKAVARHGNMLQVLQQFAGLPVAELKQIIRQSGSYKDAVADIQDGRHAQALGKLYGMGWVDQAPAQDVTRRAVETCWDAMKGGKSFIVIGITHKQNDEITAGLRERLRAAGEIGKDDVVVDALKPVTWSDAEKADLVGRYEGGEVIQFTQNSPGFTRGAKVSPAQLHFSGKPVDPTKFAVYTRAQLALAKGDVVRITAGGTTREGHRLNNGQKYVFKGLDKEGHLVIEGGKATYTLDRGFGHLAHGLVDTSFKAQGQTKDRVVAVMAQQALPAIHAEQFYVDLSRAREKATIVTDLGKDDLLKAVQRGDTRKSATELMAPKPKKKPRLSSRVALLAEKVRQVAAKAVEVITQPIQRSTAYER